MSFLTDILLKPLHPGDEAPRLIIPDQEGHPVDLGEIFRTGVTLIYFYPKADTPGCTAQACSLRDGFKELQERGVRIYGVSTDTPEAQKRFQKKFKLPFPLLADSEKQLIRAFGVPCLFQFVARQSFLVREGKIIAHIRNVHAGRHAEEVRTTLERLSE